MDSIIINIKYTKITPKEYKKNTTPKTQKNKQQTNFFMLPPKYKGVGTSSSTTLMSQSYDF